VASRYRILPRMTAIRQLAREFPASLLVSWRKEAQAPVCQYGCAYAVAIREGLGTGNRSLSFFDRSNARVPHIALSFSLVSLVMVMVSIFNPSVGNIGPRSPIVNRLEAQSVLVQGTKCISTIGMKCISTIAKCISTIVGTTLLYLITP
jgi:hypothetical protein